MSKKINIKNVDEIYNYGLSCLEKVGVNVSLNDIKSALSTYLEDICSEEDIRDYLEEVYNIFIPEEEISLTVEEIYNYGLEYSKRKNLNLSYNEVVDILLPHVEYLLTEYDIEDRIDEHFEDDYEFIPEEEDDSDWEYEFEPEEEEEYEEEYEYFM